MAKTIGSVASGASVAPIQNKRRWVLGAQHIEHPYGKTLTVPDETMSIKEIMQKFVRGMPQVAGGLVKEGQWREDDSVDIDDFDLMELERMDVVERGEVFERLKALTDAKLAKIEAVRKDVEARNKRVQDAKAEKERLKKEAGNRPLNASGKASQKDPKSGPK